MVSVKTKILGIIGYPIEHSLSPLMHNSVIDKMGLKYVYLPFEVKPADLKSAVDSIKALNIAGINVTIPHKEKVIKYLCSVSEEAEQIGAVNTIVNKNGCLIGYNTDYYGFLRSVTEKTNVKNKIALMLGCGGVSKAIAFALFKAGIKKLIVSDIDTKKMKNFLNLKLPISKIKSVKIDNISETFKEIDIFINATPIGMKENDSSPVDKKLLNKNIFIYDVIYNRKTRLLNDAEVVGAAFSGGLDMLVYQGAKSFELWTGIKPPVELMKKVLVMSKIL